MTSNTLSPVDADTIRTTYESVLRGTCDPARREPDTVNELLRWYVQLLLPAVQTLASRMRGETRRTAVHVLVRTSQSLSEDPGSSPACDSYELAVMARALLALHQHPGPLGEPMGGDEIAEKIDRRLCGACWAPIAEDEPFERRTFASESRGGIHGYVHAERCLDRPPLPEAMPRLCRQQHLRTT